jgi:ribonuclease BN (tRNA processing enzyme)|tara:strand:- start:2494 stop:3249 length:756 start_codon:yes stop_codon:yes gene_type:complete
VKLTVLGSGVLIPFPKRGNSGYFLQTEKHCILIDGGSGTLRRMVDFGIDYKTIDTICYSHLHPDHTLDLVPLLFAYRHDPGLVKPKPLHIVAPVGFESYYDRLMELYGEWVLSDWIEISIQEISRGEVVLDDLLLRCGHTEHTDHSVTYRFERERGGSVFYSGDSDFSDELIDSAKGVDIMILECSFPDSLKRKGHLTPSECGRIATEAGCKRLVLTHLYPEILETDIISTMAQYYQGEVDLAYDGMEIKL